MLPNPPDPQLESADGDTYLLSADFAVNFGHWMRGLQFTIPAGFKTDMASIPRIFRAINDRASLGTLSPLIHDFLCDRRGKIVTNTGETIQVHWFDVNLLFLVLMRIDGIVWHRALIAFLAVTIGSPKW